MAKSRIGIIVRRFSFQAFLIVITFIAAWFIFSASSSRGEFFITGTIDEKHVFRVYDFSATEPGNLSTSLSWESDDSLQLRITDEDGKVVAQENGQSPIELSSVARSGQTYKLYVLGSTKGQSTKFTLSAANKPTEIVTSTNDAVLLDNGGE